MIDFAENDEDLADAEVVEPQKVGSPSPSYSYSTSTTSTTQGHQPLAYVYRETGLRILTQFSPYRPNKVENMVFILFGWYSKVQGLVVRY